MDNFIVREGIVLEEIKVDEGEGALEGNENERTVLEENEVIVLEDSEEENEEISEVPANRAPVAYEGIKIYISQSTISDQRQALLFNIGEPFEVPMDEFDQEWWPLVMNV
ncbi:riboflavin-specific deaminase [Gigaspora margarita]|uniref:Riboflavin-specific deaminase n=1 Tax=Gigaspora margarita TaxID=4874 RepID=A0A8H3ZZ03_GIGMA|nr:riboflavin-specific deaminase [Gigaspora margarita]